MGLIQTICEGDFISSQELINFIIENNIKGFHHISPLWRGIDKRTGEETETTDLSDLKEGTATFKGLEAETH